MFDNVGFACDHSLDSKADNLNVLRDNVAQKTKVYRFNSIMFYFAFLMN